MFTTFTPVMVFAYAIIGIPTFFLTLRIFKLLQNYQKARKLDLPIYTSLFTWQDPLWMAFSSCFVPLLSYLPFPPFDGIPYSWMGWADLDKGRVNHERLGPAFAVVSPNRLEIYCADPNVCMELTSKYRTWIKSPELYAVFMPFGQNINTVNGSEWQRHRKITSQAFREETYELVWNESRRQASQLLDAVQKHGSANFATLRQDLALLAMHVLSAAVFGHSYSYGSGLSQVEPGHELSYFASLSFILKNMIRVVLFKGIQAPNWLLPRFLRELKLAVSEYQLYLQEAVESEHKAGGGKREGASLVSALMQANQEAKHDDRSGKPVEGARTISLSDEELFGNIFMFNMAGFETTSFSLSFTIPHLAIQPELQRWIQEEIDQVFGASKESELDYEAAFHRLPRCRALMFETLRVHSVIPSMPRLSPANESTDLFFPSLQRNITIPQDSYVIINFPALHNDPKRWGTDVYQYNPGRWLTTTPPNSTITNPAMTSAASNDFGEHLIPEPQPSKANPEAPMYMPFLHGPRVCPGKKFGQVEFVAVIATIFKDWRVEPRTDWELQFMKESLEYAEFNMTPKLYKSEKAGVRWVRRGEA